MIKYIALLILGLGLGYFLSKANKEESSKYFVLEEDCVIADIGTLKKGAKLKYVESTSEGITRYSLYLNTKGIKLTPYEDKRKYLIIPYFLFGSE
jgi:hypothetical protein